MPNLCRNCDDLSGLRIGDTYNLRCPKCCTHPKGWWLLSYVYAGWREGYETYACKHGCGAIVSREKDPV